MARAMPRHTANRAPKRSNDQVINDRSTSDDVQHRNRQTTRVTDTQFPLEPTSSEAQATIADEFAYFSDWSERYQYLIDLGRKLPPLPAEFRTEEHRLLGCQSMVWI